MSHHRAAPFYGTSSLKHLGLLDVLSSAPYPSPSTSSTPRNTAPSNGTRHHKAIAPAWRQHQPLLHPQRHLVC